MFSVVGAKERSIRNSLLQLSQYGGSCDDFVCGWWVGEWVGGCWWLVVDFVFGCGDVYRENTFSS